MLSTITPFAERARRHRYPATAAWFVLGGLAGGATLGVGAALAALAVSSAGLSSHPPEVAAAAAVAALGAAAVDLDVFGPVIPVIRRQVDDRWLARYRPWFYGAGFGWQVGVGVATYVMTAGVFLLLVMAALTGSPLEALGVCAAFGLARGLTVFLTAAAWDPARLRVLHGRLDRAGPAVRATVIVVEVVVAVGLVSREWLPGGVIVIVAAAGLALSARPGAARGRAT
jgi:hypothetical protein